MVRPALPSACAERRRTQSCGLKPSAHRALHDKMTIGADQDPASKISRVFKFAIRKPIRVSDASSGECVFEQAYIGSSANPGWRDFAVVAEVVRGRAVPHRVSFDVNP